MNVFSIPLQYQFAFWKGGSLGIRNPNNFEKEASLNCAHKLRITKFGGHEQASEVLGNCMEDSNQDAT